VDVESCKTQPGIFMGRLRNADEESASVVGVSVEICARHLTDISERRYNMRRLALWYITLPW